MVTTGFNLTAPWIAPGPKWSEALSTWDIFWHVHIYFFGSVFALTALYIVHRILQLLYGYNLKESNLELIIFLFALLFSLSRSVILFVDPYHQGTILTGAQPTRVLWGLGTPCYIAINVFMLMLLLKDSNLTCCGICTSKRPFLFLVVVVTLQLGLFVVKNSLPDTILLLEQACQTWAVLAQIAFVLLLLVLSVIIKRKLLKSKGLQIKPRLVRLILLTTFIISIHCGVTVYSIYTIGLFDKRPEFIEAWKWWAIETGLRSTEMIWSELIIMINSKKRRECLHLEAPDYDTYDFFKALANYRNSESTSDVKANSNSTSRSSGVDSTSKSSNSTRSRGSISQQSSHRRQSGSVYISRKSYEGGDVNSLESVYTRDSYSARDDIQEGSPSHEYICTKGSLRKDNYKEREHCDDADRNVIYRKDKERPSRNDSQDVLIEYRSTGLLSHGSSSTGESSQLNESDSPRGSMYENSHSREDFYERKKDVNDYCSSSSVIIQKDEVHWSKRDARENQVEGREEEYDHYTDEDVIADDDYHYDDDDDHYESDDDNQPQEYENTCDDVILDDDYHDDDDAYYYGNDDDNVHHSDENQAQQETDFYDKDDYLDEDNDEHDNDVYEYHDNDGEYYDDQDYHHGDDDDGHDDDHYCESDDSSYDDRYYDNRYTAMYEVSAVSM